MLSKEVQDDMSRRRRAEVNARRLLYLMAEAGVPESTLDITEAEVARMIADPWDKCGAEPVDVAGFVWNRHKEWARRGTFVMIEGGTKYHEDARDRLMHVCMLKAIVANFDTFLMEGEGVSLIGGYVRRFTSTVGRTHDFVSIVPKLVAFEKDRLAILDAFSKIPVLAIREIDPDREPRETSDCPTILDSMLRQRRMMRMPTILTVMGESRKIIGKGGYGKELSDIANMPHDPSVGIIRVMANIPGDPQGKASPGRAAREGKA